MKKSKYEVFQIFVNLFHLVQNQFGKNIKRIKFNNHTEYVNQEFFKFLSHNVIVHELTFLNTPQCRKENHYLIEVAKALLFKISFLKPIGKKLC